MIEALIKFDNRDAAGVLARAALSLEDFGNPAAAPVLKDEDRVRGELLAEVKKKLGITKEELDTETAGRISAFLDEETDKLADPTDMNAAFARLTANGALPSDLYEIEIIRNIKDFLGKGFQKESELIVKTVHSPTQSQHYGPPIRPNEPHLISLFARQFQTSYPFKNFTMLVAGQRGQRNHLTIHQAWRIYASQVKMVGSESLVDLLHRFADAYASDITVDGEKGHFFISSKLMQSRTLEVGTPGKRHTTMLTQFAQTNPFTKEMYSAMVVSINLDQYVETLRKLDVTEIW